MRKLCEMRVNRNATFKLGNLETIHAFMYKTRKNFSATLNIIIEQWDDFSCELEKSKREEKQKLETQTRTKHFDQIKKAKNLAAEVKKKQLKE